MTRNFLVIILTFIALNTLNACSRSESLINKTPPMPQNWQSQQAKISNSDAAMERTKWWKIFNDEILDELIDITLENNPDRAIAQSRLREARGALRSAKSTRFPTIAANSNAGRGEGQFGDVASSYQATFDASYEIDLFGQNEARINAAEAGLNAFELTEQDVTLSLIAETARAYIQFRAAQRQAIIARENLLLEQKVLQIATDLYDAGELPLLDLEQATSIISATQATVYDFDQQADAAAFRVALLTGSLPEEVAPLLTVDKPLPQSNAIPLLRTPSEAIRQRPDIRAAQAQLAAASHLADAAFRDLFPRLSLNSLFGVVENVLVDRKEIWDIAINASITLLDFGNLRGLIDSANAREEQAYETYRKTVLSAISEIETALSDYAHIHNRTLALEASLDSARGALQLSKQLYTEGEIAFNDVLDAQKQVNAVEQNLTAVQAADAESLVRLYKAIGVY